MESSGLGRRANPLPTDPCESMPMEFTTFSTLGKSASRCEMKWPCADHHFRSLQLCSHALQLRQAKLSFPNVHLVVGVCSDQLCADQKSGPAMTHAERCEAVSHCRWVDEVAPEAPWEVDQAWIDRYNIDYVAHDELVYAAKGKVDVYDFVKKQGS
jgi:cytidyltransferase-like protein